MIIIPTSHFVGVSLDSTVFENLFYELSHYIEEHQLAGSSIELQRSDTLHITLYYLPSDLSGSDMIHYREYLNSVQQDIEFRVSELAYFSRGDSPYVLYILPSNIEYFQSQNTTLASIFTYGDIEDNQFSYIPHMTILRILDPDVFGTHRASIENIIRRSMELLSRESLRYTIDLYRVDSRIRPELQEPIDIGDIFDK